MSTPQPDIPIYGSVIELQPTLRASRIQANENGERFCLPTLLPAVRGYKRLALRSVHLISNGAGCYLSALESDGPQWSPDPLAAVSGGLSWLSSTVGAARLHRLREQRPELALGLALVMLRATAPGAWEVAHVFDFSRQASSERLIP